MASKYDSLSEKELEALIASKKRQNALNSYDDMSEEELESKINQRKKELSGDFVKEGRTWGESLARQGARVGRSAATGIAGLADLPNLAAVGLNYAGLKETPTFYKPFGERTQEWIDEKTHGRLKPENKAEEYMDVAGESVAPLLLAPFTGGASLTATGARGVAKATGSKAASKVASTLGKTNPYTLTGANASGSLGAAAGSKYYTDTNDNPHILGALAAGAFGGSAGRRAYNAKNLVMSPINTSVKVTSKAAKFSPEKYEQLRELGLPVSMSDVSNGKMSRRIESVLSHSPGGSGVFEKFYDKKNNALARNLGLESNENAKLLSANPSHHLAKEGAAGYKKKIYKEYEDKKKIFAPFEEEQLISRAPVDVSDIKNKLSHESRGLATAEERRLFGETPHGEVTKTIRDLGRSKDGTSYKALHGKDDLSSPDTVSYGALELLRKKATKQKEAAKSGTEESRQYSDIANMLSGKRHQHIETYGTPEQAKASKEAKHLYWNYASKNGENLKKRVYGLLDSDSDKSAFNKVTQNEKYTKVVYDGLSKKDKKEFTGTLLSSLGKKGDGFSVNSLHSKWNKLTKPVRDEILSNMSENDRKKLEKTLDFIGKNKEEISKTANTSNTAHTTKNIEMMAKGLSGVASLVTLNPIPLASVFGATYASNLASKAMTNPKILERMYKISQKEKGLPKETWKSKALATSSKAAVQANQQEKDRQKKTRIIDLGKNKVVYE